MTLNKVHFRISTIINFEISEDLLKIAVLLT